MAMKGSVYSAVYKSHHDQRRAVRDGLNPTRRRHAKYSSRRIESMKITLLLVPSRFHPLSLSLLSLLHLLYRIIRITKYAHAILRVENPTKPYMGLEPISPCVCCEYSPRDLSILASSHISGQVNSWDTRTGIKPVQISHPRYSHR